MTLDEAFMIAAAIDPSAMQVAIQDYMNCSGISPKDPGAAQTAGNMCGGCGRESIEYRGNGGAASRINLLRL